MESKNIRVKYDQWLLWATLVLVFGGTIMIYSASSIYAKERFGDEYLFIKKHLIFVFVGMGLAYLGAKLDHAFLKKLAYPAVIFSAVLLGFLLVSNSFVHKAGAAARWISIGGFSCQPAEFAKIALIIFLAAHMSKVGERIKSFKEGFLPCIAVSVIIVTLIVSQPDFGTAVTLSFVVAVMLFAGGVRIVYIGCMALLAAPPAVYLILKSGYRLKRVLTFLDPWKDPLGSGFQVIQSFIAFANGGLLGEGLGAGKQKLMYLPEGHTDFIFSVIGEELGFAGAVAVLILFVIFIYKGFSIATKMRDTFSVLMALGITTMIGLQAFINMGVTIGLLPTKGLTLPFISYGGSSLFVTMFAAGILINLSSRMNQVPGFDYGRRVTD